MRVATKRVAVKKKAHEKPASKIPYTYVFVRKDMKMVYYIIQAAHAAQEAGIAFGAHPSGEQIHHGLFEVKDEQELFAVAKHLEAHKIKFKMFYEPDDDTGYTAIATEPVVDMKHVVQKFKFFR